MLPKNAPPSALRVAMDLDRARREWADTKYVVKSAKKYVQLYDQFMQWLQRSDSTTRDGVFVWRDSDENIIASSSEHFEHMMNNHAMGLMSAYVGDMEQAMEHFNAAQEAGERIPIIVGQQYARYNTKVLSSLAQLLQRAARVQELTTIESAEEREALAHSLLKDFPDIPRASVWYKYSKLVSSALLEHAIRAHMHNLVQEDKFAEAHVYASILGDERACEFLESMSRTARQSLMDPEKYMETLETQTNTEGVVEQNTGIAAVQYLGFDAVPACKTILNEYES